LLHHKFEKMGARVLLRPARRLHTQVPQPLAINIRRDERGEYFDLAIDDQQLERLDIVDVRPRERHLLLMAAARPYQGTITIRGHWRRREVIVPPLSRTVEKSKYLCGHDERHWFVAAVPEEAHASNVKTAMQALKPVEVVRAEAQASLPFDQRFSRKNRAFVRQGEWFFLPWPNLVVRSHQILRHEPLQRSGGKPHWAEFAVRFGGETVYVSQGFPRGLREPEYRAHLARHPEDRGKFRIMQRNASMFVRGRISHPDHATIVLKGWHAVLMNTEHRAKARANVVFLD